ncbi:hypothetical protein FEM48_Zijuj12G0051900 [Ziziphus jujuba var. spinosa]|uniref:UV-stimulated scaffold protein A C-terminal domain-containing protein n=1 Tax=Ziziphus jujuba var. spinosa TaxID=714518 RepID=A0A978UBD1_ZIZJJ|nr:hypothetical protein FEM48_Zijuj12G0051900 [Ziziphus jujuba var. spinosa]
MEEGGGKVRALIEKATNSTQPEVDPRLLKAIKSVVRYSDSELRLAVHALMEFMKRDHSQVRYLTLLIIDQLFMRSKLFRTLLVENLDQLLTLSVGFRRNQPLPAPPSVATLLRNKAIEFLEKWNSSFGIQYRQLRLGFDYLKNTLRFQFPNLQANAARIQQERRERERRSKEILLNKFETLKENFSSIKEEIQSTIDEIGECLDIVRNTGEESMLLARLDDDDDDDIEEFRSSELQQIRRETLEEGEKVHENSENKVVFDALRELYKLLVTKHLVSVQEWISVLVRVEVTDNRFRDSSLKDFIDIRNLLQSVKKKCEESGCSLPKATTNEEEEDFWEEGKIELNKSGTVSACNRENGDLAIVSEPSDSKITVRHGKKKLESEGVGTESSSPRSKLLAEAPMVNWGPYLDNWGSKRDVLANQRGLELESHWGRVDYDAVIPAEKIAELNVHATVYKEEQLEIQQCRAPLRKGGLCQRRDLRVCPFHGPITPRDDEGKPLDQNLSKDEIASDSGTDLVEAEQLARQAVKNVRARDKDVARKREIDRQSMKHAKRAKLAKIREHNEAVLRDAALASTSRSATAGEDMMASGSGNASDRSKKQALASMLRKKVTPKDRLAQRLLNTKARDATIRQLTSAEDANYKEAFPSQW